MNRRSVASAAAVALFGLGTSSLLAGQERSVYENLQTFSDVLNYARLNYVDSVSVAPTVRAAIDGALRSLDPHSYFLSREDWERFLAWQQGRWVTTGLFLEYEEGAVAVQAVVPGSPAAKAGILPGDRLLSINDTSVAGLSVQRLQAGLAGEKVSRVRLVLERGPRFEPDTFSVTLKQSAVPVRSAVIVRMVDSATGYLRVQDFKLGAGRDVHEALARLTGDGARQVVLDLRGNPGGSMTAAVDVASEVLPQSTLVFRTRGRKADTNREYLTDHEGHFSSIPLVVLIDGATASAAEALAACLQDHDRALIVGRRSFGKALQQVAFPLRSGDVVMLTVARVVSPSGRIIQRRYAGLRYEQYVSLAGKGGDLQDTTAFTTDHGRPMRGGGGVAPDVWLSLSAPPPTWWSVALDSGWADAVAERRPQPPSGPTRAVDGCPRPVACGARSAVPCASAILAPRGCAAGHRG